MDEAEKFEKETYKHLDGLTPRNVADEWGIQLNGPGGSTSGAMIYHLYMVSQPSERRKAIQRRLRYLTSERGREELDRMCEEGIIYEGRDEKVNLVFKVVDDMANTIDEFSRKYPRKKVPIENFVVGIPKYGPRDQRWDILTAEVQDKGLHLTVRKVAEDDDVLF